MLIVSVAFIVCWLPNNAFFLVLFYSVQSTNLVVGYYPTVFLVYLNVCLNPFIYALKHEGVKSQLARLIVCRKPPHSTGDTASAAAAASSRSGAGGTRETRTGLARR